MAGGPHLTTGGPHLFFFVDHSGAPHLALCDVGSQDAQLATGALEAGQPMIGDQFMTCTLRPNWITHTHTHMISSIPQKVR